MKSCKDCINYKRSGCRLHHVRHDMIDPDNCMDYQETVDPDIGTKKSTDLEQVLNSIDGVISTLYDGDADRVDILGIINRLSSIKEKILTIDNL